MCGKALPTPKTGVETDGWASRLIDRPVLMTRGFLAVHVRCLSIQNLQKNTTPWGGGGGQKKKEQWARKCEEKKMKGKHKTKI